MLKEDVISLAKEMNIKWDYDPVFMAISQEITGKSLLEEMSEDELKTMHNYIAENPYPFTKMEEKKIASKKPNFFRSNEDYNGDFLDKVRKRLKALKKKLDNKKACKEIEGLEQKIS